MNPSPTTTAIYTRVAPILMVVSLLIGIGAAVGTYVNDRANVRQDHQRIIDEAASSRAQQGLLECFDKFATQLAGGLPPVRAASAARDDALAAAEVELRDALVDIVSGADVKHELRKLVRALNAFQTASDHLSAVRAANPYPPAPATFCASPD